MYHAEVSTIDNSTSLQRIAGRRRSVGSFVMALPARRQTHVACYQMDHFGPSLDDKHIGSSGIGPI